MLRCMDQLCYAFLGMKRLCKKDESYPPEAPVIKASRPDILLSTMLLEI